MKNIKVVDVNGNEAEGSWNEKTYASKHEGCVRIYLNNKEVHVEESQLSDEDLSNDKFEKIDYMTKDFTAEQTAELINMLLNREEVMYALLEKEGITKKRYKNKAIEGINNVLAEIKEMQDK